MTLPILVDEGLALLFLQPLTLFVLAAALWSVQSALVTNFARRYVYPQLYRNAFVEWFFAEISIILHEASHLLSAVFTGSTVDLRQSYVGPRAGRIAAVRSESIGGWLSCTIAATAPSFLPPLFFAVAFILLAQQQIAFDSLFVYPRTVQQVVQSFQDNTQSVLLPALSALTLLFDLSQPMAFLLIYLAIVCSIAAGPSEGDWRSTLELFFSPVPAATMLGAFFLMNALFANLGIGFLVPFSLLLIYLFVIVAFGIFFAALFVSWLALAYRNARLALAAIAVFGLAYSALFMYGVGAIVCFFLSLLIAAVVAVVASPRRAHF